MPPLPDPARSSAGPDATGGVGPTLILLYGRPGCHLCDEAREKILELRTEGLDFELREIDIERDDGLHSKYLERIPVVSIAGEIVSELAIDLHAVRARLDTVAA